MQVPIIAAVFLGLFALLSGSHAQSFNCNSARGEDEETICSIREIGELDTEMAGLYRQLEESLSPSLQRMLLAMQRGWLQSRRACGSDDECLSEHYLARIAELKALAEADLSSRDWGERRDDDRPYRRNERDRGDRGYEDDDRREKAPDPYGEPRYDERRPR